MNKFVLGVMVISFVACSVRDKSYEIRPVQRAENIFTIDLDTIPKEKEIYLSTIFKSVKPIILETGKNILIGNIDVLQAFDSKLFILDRMYAKSLFVFDMEGTFIKKIGALGRGPGEYMNITDFTINPEKKEIYLLDSSGYMVHQYTTDGVYIGSFRIDTAEEIAVRFIQYHQGNLYTDVYRFSKDKENDYLLQVVNMKSGQQEGRFLKTKQYNKGWNELLVVDQHFFTSRLSEEPKYIQMFMDTIISIHKNGITPFLAIKSKDMVSSKDMEALTEEDPSDRYRHLMFRTNKIFSIIHYIESKNHVVFKYRHGKILYSVLHDLSTSTTRIANTLTNDLVYTGNGLVPHFEFSDEEGAYEWINPLYMPDLLDKIQQGALVPDLENEDQLLTLTEESNPVIFYYEYK
jgi:hypothetical protein